jgi:tetratricopeptide (TPR) repeat protein
MTTPGEPPPITPEAEARIRELQAIITDSQRRADKATDEDIREALNLQVSSLGLKVSRLRRGESEDAPPKAAVADEEELEPLPETTPEQLYESDMLIQRAMLEKRRGNKQAASDLLKKAVDVAPGASGVLESLGDDYLDRRQYAAAQEAYKKASRADPTNVSVERKLAQISSQGLASLSVEDQLRMGSSDSIFIQSGESVANPKIAVFLSCCIPGSGQLVLGQPKKGVTYFLIWFLSLVILGLVHTLDKGKGLTPIAYIPMAIAAMDWMASIVDASSNVKTPKVPPPNRTPNKPVPPVNLPYE